MYTRILSLSLSLSLSFSRSPSLAHAWMLCMSALMICVRRQEWCGVECLSVSVSVSVSMYVSVCVSVHV